MPSHTIAERRKNNPTPSQQVTPEARASAKLFGSMISPPSSFKENTPPILPVPVLKPPGFSPTEEAIL